MKNIDVEAGRVSGRFMIEKILPGGERVVAADWFENLVTDNGLDALASVNASELVLYCGAGAGTTPPSNGDSALQSALGSRSSPATQVTGPTTTLVDHTFLRCVYTFAIGAVVGNVAEIGTFSATTGGTMFSRALIKDTGGNPTTVTVLADEQLVVTYELRKYPPLTDHSGTISITVDGVPTNYNYTIRAANFNTDLASYWAAMRPFTAWNVNAYASEAGTLAAIGGQPAGGVQQSSRAVAAYTPGSFYRDATFTWGIGTANFATGIGTIAFGDVTNYSTGGAGYQISFSPKLPKNATRTLALPFRLSWGRHAA